MTSAFDFLSENFLAQLPGYAGWKDLNSKYLFCNQNGAALMGFSKLEKVVGILDEDLRCNAALYAEAFRKQDQKVICHNKEIKFLDIHPYADGKFHTGITTKKPLLNGDGGIIGTFFIMQDIEPQQLAKFYLNVSNLEKKFKSKKACQNISQELACNFDFTDLTEKESEVLYYFIRGKSAREIGELINRSQRTIEFHLDNIKNKIGISKKSEIIQYCVENGFLNILPKSLLATLINISIEL